MRVMLSKTSVLALGAALVGSLALPQVAAAAPSLASQSRAAQSQAPGLGTAAVYEGIAPDMSYNTSGGAVGVNTGDDGSARDVNGQLQPVENPNPYGVNSYDADVSFTQADGQRNYARRENPSERAGRYYGSAYSNGELTAAAYDEADNGSARGKTALKARRLGVFDQSSVEKRRLSIKPYIEAGQVAQAILSPSASSDVLTYSVLAAGADATINGRNNQGSISARYERRIGWNRKVNGDGITGIARLSSSIVPDAVRIDYGGFANRTYVSTNGAAFSTGSVSADSLTQIYSVYAGPSLSTQLGAAAITGHYHVGYTSVGTNSSVTAPGASAVTDTLNHATVQDAKLAIGTRPGDVLPVGLGASAGYYQEDVSNLSQRVTDKNARAEITIPIAGDVALVGGVGVEQVKVSSRNAVVDTNGNALRDSRGQIITDYSKPRYIAFESEGLIWDAGMVWRPSPRTNAEIHVGRRYGQIGAYGFLNYAPNDHSNLNIVVYQGITGFGGALTNSLFNLPSQFTGVRDAITGNMSSCVSSLGGGNCLGGALSSVNSTLYRGRGVSAGYSLNYGRWRGGVGAGYDRRQYITAQQTVFASVNGKVDQYYWLATFMGYQMTQRSTFETTLNAYKYQSGLNSTGDINALRAVALYQYNVSRHVTANASLAIDGIMRKATDDVWSSAGSVGMRYTF
jgi:hypothetical protein